MKNWLNRLLSRVIGGKLISLDIVTNEGKKTTYERWVSNTTWSLIQLLIDHRVRRELED